MKNINNAFLTSILWGLVCLPLAGLLAQTNNYTPFDFSSSVWEEEYFSYPLTFFSNYSVTTNEEITINGQMYYRIRKTGEASTDDINWIAYDEYAGAIRENNNKQVFYIPEGESEEILLYDFNLSLGDTVPLYDMFFEESFQGVVVGIDSTEVCNSIRRRFEIEMASGELLLYPLYWTEGAGSSHGLIPIHYFFESGTTSECFSDTNCAACGAAIAGGYPVSRIYCYSYYGAYGEVFSISLQEIGDTTIQGKSCVIVEDPLGFDIRYLWYDGAQIYWFSEEEEAFFLLYDFDLGPGAILTIDLGFRPDWLSSGQECASFYINDVTYEEINGEILRVQWIEPLDNCGYFMEWGARLIERIGSDGYFVPYFSGDEIWAQLDQANFEDNIVYETNNCIVESTSEKQKAIPQIDIAPNPFSDEFALVLPEGLDEVGRIYELSIYDVYGKLVKHQSVQSGMAVNVEGLCNGVYMAVLSEEDKLVGQSRLIKQ